MAESLEFGHITKEMIVSNLKGAEDAPKVAADIVRQTITAGLPSARASGKNPQDAVQEICFGAMSGLLLIEKDLPKGAILIIKGMAEIAQKVGVEPSELMTWAMEGIARITPMTSVQVREEIRALIEQDYMGAGEVFSNLCDKHKNDQK